VHWDDPEEWDGEGGGRGVQDGEQCTPMAKPIQYCKVKKKKKKTEKKNFLWVYIYIYTYI